MKGFALAPVESPQHPTELSMLASALPSKGHSAGDRHSDKGEWGAVPERIKQGPEHFSTHRLCHLLIDLLGREVLQRSYSAETVPLTCISVEPAPRPCLVTRWKNSSGENVCLCPEIWSPRHAHPARFCVPVSFPFLREECPASSCTCFPGASLRAGHTCGRDGWAEAEV